MAASACPSLALDQMPNSRSIMMAQNRLFTSIGSVIAPAIGGTLLAVFSSISVKVGYETVGLAFGLMNITAAVILFVLAKDPYKIKKVGQLST